MSKTYKFAVVGMSHRSGVLLKLLLSNHKDVELVVAFDEVKDLYELKKNDPIYRDVPMVKTLEEVWEHEPDCVIIGSMNCDHCKHIVSAMKNKVKIFCEKPIITNDKQYKCIMDAMKALKYPQKWLSTGFVLRYSKLFKTLQEVVQGIGPVGMVNACEFLNHYHGMHFFLGWRRFQEKSGGYTVEKSVHIVDILNWCLGDFPVKVFAFGSKNYFTKETQPIIEERLLKENPNAYHEYKDYENLNPFTSSSDICDNIASTMKYSKGTNVNLSLCTYNPDARRQITFIGRDATVDFIWEPGHAEIEVTEKGVGHKNTEGEPGVRKIYRFKDTGHHGGGDQVIVDGLYEAVKNDTEMTPNIKEGFYSNNACIGVTKSLNTGEVVEVNV